MNLNQFYKDLFDYKYAGRGQIYNWSKLESLFSHFPNEKFDPTQEILATHLVLDACSHMHESCFSKDFDLAADLRGKIQGCCREVLSFTELDTKSSLYFLIENVAPYHKGKSDLSDSKFISYARPWSFYLIEGDGKESEIRLFYPNEELVEIVFSPEYSFLLYDSKTGQLNIKYIFESVDAERIRLKLCSDS